jgi:hypothetical protein
MRNLEIPLPASSGNTRRHRLNRGGNRRLNRALYTIAHQPARDHPRPKALHQPRTLPTPRSHPTTHDHHLTGHRSMSQCLRLGGPAASNRPLGHTRLPAGHLPGARAHRRSGPGPRPNHHRSEHVRDRRGRPGRGDRADLGRGGRPARLQTRSSLRSGSPPTSDRSASRASSCGTTSTSELKVLAGAPGVGRGVQPQASGGDESAGQSDPSRLTRAMWSP